MDVNYTYCPNHFAVYTNIEPLHCTPETNVMYVNYTLVFFKKQNKNHVYLGIDQSEEQFILWFKNYKLIIFLIL